jgi:hypothetical protein
MSILKKPLPVKLFFSIFASSEKNINNVIEDLEEVYGIIDIVSTFIPFDETDYYEDEFGKGLIRKLVFFERLISPEEIVKVKKHAIDIEKKYTFGEKRLVNIDPGYLALSRVVLATGKDYTHRIYLGEGVYADLTYIYKRKEGYVNLPWTYPDYAKEQMKHFFEQARVLLKKQLKGYKYE